MLNAMFLWKLLKWKKSNKNGVIFHIPLDKTVCLIVIVIVILFLCFDTLHALFGYFFPLYVDF